MAGIWHYFSRKFPLPERTVYVPSFGTKIHAGKRKNDRFAYGSVTAMRVSNNGANLCFC